MGIPSYATPAVPPLDIGRCFDDALQVYKRNFWVLFFAAAIYTVLTVFTLGILGGPLYGGVVVMTLLAMSREDKRVNLGDLFNAMGRFWPLLGLFVIETVAVLIGFALLVIPGVWLGTVWLFPMYLLIDKGLGVTDSLAASAAIVRRRGFWPNCWLTLTVIALTVIPSMIPAIGRIVGFFIDPIVWLMIASAYRQQVIERPDDLCDLFPQGFPVGFAARA